MRPCAFITVTPEDSLLICIWSESPRPLNPNDWERFNFYAPPESGRFGTSQFKYLVFNRSQNYDQVLRDLCEYKRTKPFLFPNLRQFCVDVATPTFHACQVLQLFLAPILISTEILAQSCDDSIFSDLCPSILRLVPNIRHLRLECLHVRVLEELPPRSDLSVFTLICNLHHSYHHLPWNSSSDKGGYPSCLSALVHEA